MIILKSERDIEAMRVSGAMAAEILNLVGSWIRPGVTTREIDQYAAQLIKERGAKSAFLGYRKYPGNLCISVNDQVVHGLPNDRRVQFGDIISLDCGVIYRGYIGDTAKTVAVGGCNVLAQKLMDVTERALYEGIAQAVPGNRVVDISRAIQNYVESNGFSIVREFVQMTRITPLRLITLQCSQSFFTDARTFIISLRLKLCNLSTDRRATSRS